MIQLGRLNGTACMEIDHDFDRSITMLLGVPFNMAIYRMGDKYVAARSNKFNYANYKI